MLVLLLILAQDATALVARTHALLVPPRCPVTQSADITVCGRRAADRYRVPFKSAVAAGTAAVDNAATGRVALLHRTTPIQEMSPFLVGGGVAGVSAGVKFGSGSDSGHAAVGKARPLAP